MRSKLPGIPLADLPPPPPRTMPRPVIPKPVPAERRAVPPVSESEYETIRAAILLRGRITDPIVCAADGGILDGHLRWRVHTEAEGIPCPRVVEEDIPTAESPEGRTLARGLNLARRHLSRDERAAMIRAELVEDSRSSERRSARAVAAALGVAPNTVLTIASDLVRAGQIPALDEVKGRDGRTTQPSRGKRATRAATVQNEQSPDRRQVTPPSTRRQDPPSTRRQVTPPSTTPNVPDPEPYAAKAHPLTEALVDLLDHSRRRVPDRAAVKHLHERTPGAVTLDEVDQLLAALGVDTSLLISGFRSALKSKLRGKTK